MNLDERRLKEIQQLKKGYTQMMLEAETMEEAFDYQKEFNKLEAEEQEILKRCW